MTPRTRRLAAPLAALLAWTLLSTGFYLLAHEASGAGAGGHGLLMAFLHTLPPLGVMLTAGWVTTRGADLVGSRPARLLATHAAASLLSAAGATGALYAVHRVLDPASAVTIAREHSLFWIGSSWVTLYGLAAGGAYTLRTARRLRERQAAATRAELQALRAQLNPHFLFNALHSVGVLVRKNPAGAEDMLERLGDLLRYVLAVSGPGAERGDMVTVARELAFLRDYLAIERIRFGERLLVEESVAQAALECQLPALLLQPLVENAVRHGIARRRAGGTVWLRAGRVRDPGLGDALVLEVADDGAGAAPGAWEGAAGLGLRAVREQLAARYPGSHRLEVEGRPGDGFAVRITLPATPLPGAARHAAHPTFQPKARTR